MRLSKRRNIPTYAKYIFSYLLILTVLMFGFYYIVKHQLTEKYFEEREKYVKLQTEGIVNQLNDDLVFLSQVDRELLNNKILREGRYNSEAVDGMQIFEELRKYAVSSKIISSIVYSPYISGKVYSTELPVVLQDRIFYIMDQTPKMVAFDPSKHLNHTSGQLIFLSEDSMDYLIYMPATSSHIGCIFFYVLNMGDIQMQLSSMISEEVLAIALIDEQERIVEGANSSLLLPYLDWGNYPSGVYQLDSDISICVNDEVRGGYTLISMISADFLQKQISAAFANTYFALMLLGVLGVIMIFLAMRITYLPLRRLIMKIDPDVDYRTAYLPRLERKFVDMTFENQRVQMKLDHYRSSMQKALLDSLVASGHIEHSEILPEIDRFFDANSQGKIFVVFVSRMENTCKGEAVQKRLLDIMSDDSACILLDITPDKLIYLIYYVGKEKDKEARLKEGLERLCQEKGCMAAFSQGADSPLDIPELYENASQACSQWPQIIVADSQSVEKRSELYNYPYEKLNALSELLMENQFRDAEQLMEELVQLSDKYIEAENNLQKFYVNNLLIDLVMRIVTPINMSNINFQIYGDLYYETLYYCRSHVVSEKMEEIEDNIRKLLDIYEQNHVEREEKSAPYRQVIEECYCDPNFSITVLAERFEVSVSHMSNLFKKETNTNFSDYLWMQRLNKAKELLCTTELSVDEISVAVGYNSASGFRRKFRQETGLSPSQFRETCGK